MTSRRLTPVIGLLLSATFVGCSREPSVNQGKLEGTLWQCNSGKFNDRVIPPGGLRLRLNADHTFEVVIDKERFDGKYEFGPKEYVSFDFSNDFDGMLKSNDEIHIYDPFQMVMMGDQGRELAFRRYGEDYQLNVRQRAHAESLRNGKPPAKSSEPASYIYATSGRPASKPEFLSCDTSGLKATRTASGDRLTLEANGWSFRFLPKRGEALAAGTHITPQEPAPPKTLERLPVMEIQCDLPGVHMSAHGSEFRIWELETDQAGAITKLAVDGIWSQDHPYVVIARINSSYE